MATLSFIEIILKSNWGSLIGSLTTPEHRGSTAAATVAASSASSSLDPSAQAREGTRNYFGAEGGGGGGGSSSSSGRWSRGREYYRFDGGIKGQDRQYMIDRFNKDTKSHLFLVSTRAGNMGSNLQVLLAHINYSE